MVSSMTRRGVDAIRCWQQDNFGYITREEFCALPQIPNSKVLWRLISISAPDHQLRVLPIFRIVKGHQQRRLVHCRVVPLQYDSPPSSRSTSPEPEWHNVSCVGGSAQTHVLNSLTRPDDIVFDGTGDWDSFERKFCSQVN